VSRVVAPSMLIVDDDAAFSEIAEQLFSQLGYLVRCAENGFVALAMMKEMLPDIIICDLNMPRMSGFELLSIVRRRFPHIPVVAISGEYVAADQAPGFFADAYLEKGGSQSPEVLVTKIRDLLERSPLRPNNDQTSSAPVWIPAQGKSYLVLTCANCLRAFSLPVPADSRGQIVERRAKCEFCGTEVVYVWDGDVTENLQRTAH